MSPPPHMMIKEVRLVFEQPLTVITCVLDWQRCHDSEQTDGFLNIIHAGKARNARNTRKSLDPDWLLWHWMSNHASTPTDPFHISVFSRSSTLPFFKNSLMAFLCSTAAAYRPCNRVGSSRLFQVLSSFSRTTNKCFFQGRCRWWDASPLSTKKEEKVFPCDVRCHVCTAATPTRWRNTPPLIHISCDSSGPRTQRLESNGRWCKKKLNSDVLFITAALGHRGASSLQNLAGCRGPPLWSSVAHLPFVFLPTAPPGRLFAQLCAKTELWH